MKTAQEMIEIYKRMGGMSMLPGIRDQYLEMALGGGGGRLGFKPEDSSCSHPNGPTCRDYNYPDKPDSFFQEVCDGMGW
jgi:hypothetical protein